MAEEKKVREKPIINSVQNIDGLRKLKQQVKALDQEVNYYIKLGLPLPPMLKAQLPTLKSNKMALSRLEVRPR